MFKEEEKNKEKEVVPMKPFGYWTQNENLNMRKFFDDFASNLGLDPLDPDSWYKFTNKHIMAVKVRGEEGRRGEEEKRSRGEEEQKRRGA